METKKHIETNEKTKLEFDKFKSDLGFKLKQKITSDRGIKILLNTFKDFTRLNNKLNKYTKNAIPEVQEKKQ